jgi:hypothetical protein
MKGRGCERCAKKEYFKKRIIANALIETRSVSVNVEFQSLSGLFALQRHSGAVKIRCIPE